MGAVCSCLPVEDFEDYVNRNSFSYRNCMCLRFSLQNFFHVYYSLFRRENVQAIPSSIEGASLSSTASMDSSLADVYRSLPLPLPYDADPRYSCMHRGGLFPRHEKDTTDSHDVSEPVRRSDIVSNSESLSTGGKCTESTCEEGIQEQENCKSSKKLSSVESITVKGYFYLSLEDEDVCPTCLEEYTEENPKIITKCSHHFHLGCIYEWMERSESCPVCGKVMAFDESS